MKTIFFIFILALQPILGSCQQISKDSLQLNDEISFLFLGDIMTHQLQIESAYNEKTGKYDFSTEFKHIQPIIKDVDVVIGNLEVTFGGAPYAGYPNFSSPDQLAFDIKDAGIKYVATANNHINDTGLKGFRRTLNLLDSVGLVHTGTFRDIDDMKRRHPVVITEKGWRIALFNYTYGINGDKYSPEMIINEIDSASIAQDLSNAKKLKYDAIIVFFHWGTEYKRHSNAEQQMLANLCFENGANAVIGAHPHVIQEMEKTNFKSKDGKEKEVIVAYSLGNYVSNYADRRYSDGGALIRFTLKKFENKEVTINNQGYYLVWVYREEKTEKLKTYYVLPVSQFENDMTLGFDQLKQMNTFISDSRTLLNKNNLNVKEYKYNSSTKKWEIDKN